MSTRRTSPSPSAADTRGRPELSGRVLDGRHELLERIGQGGMSDVYRAYFLPGESFEAVKVLDPALADDEDHRRRFLAEFRVLHRLDHPGLVRAFDHHRSGEGITYFSMELLAGEALDDLLWRTGPLPPARAIRLLLPVCDALAALHDHGVLHRDLKPANLILLDGDGPPRVKPIASARPTADGRRPRGRRRPATRISRTRRWRSSS